jgi:hypothetical protein
MNSSIPDPIIQHRYNSTNISAKNPCHDQIFAPSPTNRASLLTPHMTITLEAEPSRLWREAVRRVRLSSTFSCSFSLALRASLSALRAASSLVCWHRRLIMYGMVKSWRPLRHDSSRTTSGRIKS